MTPWIWCIPIGSETALISAPFHGITTLVNRSMADAVRRCLDNPGEPLPEGADWVHELRPPGNRPEQHRGAPDPLFLGLIPTRGCMMSCAYCDFTGDGNYHRMSFDMIRRAINFYAHLMSAKKDPLWNIHFFGGEPFAAFEEVVFAVSYARRKAAFMKAPTHFEVTTNGYYPEQKCCWIAENFDTVVLSFDGFPKAQNRHRPGPNGADSFDRVCRNADIFAAGSCELIIRSCISAENVNELSEWAAFTAQRWTPSALCLEPMIESEPSRRNGLLPPDPEVYMKNWTAVYRVLAKEKIRLICSSGDISAVKNSLCPMGRDALIIDPEGRVGSCWQLPENRAAEGHSLHFGNITAGELCIDEGQLEKQRELCEANRESCRSCFCYAWCAGGCLLNKERNGSFCRITRALTLWQLLEQLGCGSSADNLLGSSKYLDWLSKAADFRLGSSLFDSVPAINTETQFVRTAPQRTDSFHGLSPQPAIAAPSQGWFRDGDRIIIADTRKNQVQILEGNAALRFQLEHAGINQTYAAHIWKELHTEAG